MCQASIRPSLASTPSSPHPLTPPPINPRCSESETNTLLPGGLFRSSQLHQLIRSCGVGRPAHSSQPPSPPTPPPSHHHLATHRVQAFLGPRSLPSLPFSRLSLPAGEPCTTAARPIPHRPGAAALCQGCRRSHCQPPLLLLSGSHHRVHPTCAAALPSVHRRTGRALDRPLTAPPPACAPVSIDYPGRLLSATSIPLLSAPPAHPSHHLLPVGRRCRPCSGGAGPHRHGLTTPLVEGGSVSAELCRDSSVTPLSPTHHRPTPTYTRSPPGCRHPVTPTYSVPTTSVTQLSHCITPPPIGTYGWSLCQPPNRFPPTQPHPSYAVHSRLSIPVDLSVREERERERGRERECQ